MGKQSQRYKDISISFFPRRWNTSPVSPAPSAGVKSSATVRLDVADRGGATETVNEKQRVFIELGRPLQAVARSADWVNQINVLSG